MASIASEDEPPLKMARTEPPSSSDGIVPDFKPPAPEPVHETASETSCAPKSEPEEEVDTQKDNPAPTVAEPEGLSGTSPSKQKASKRSKSASAPSMESTRKREKIPSLTTCPRGTEMGRISVPAIQELMDYPNCVHPRFRRGWDLLDANQQMSHIDLYLRTLRRLEQNTQVFLSNPIKLIEHTEAELAALRAPAPVLPRTEAPGLVVEPATPAVAPHMATDFSSQAPKTRSKTQAAEQALERTGAIFSVMLDLIITAERRVSNPCFAAPSTEVGYDRIVTEPMDFTTLRTMITEQRITTADEFARLLLLIYRNAQVYYPPQHAFHEAGKNEERWASTDGLPSTFPSLRGGGIIKAILKSLPPPQAATPVQSKKKTTVWDQEMRRLIFIHVQNAVKKDRDVGGKVKSIISESGTQDFMMLPEPSLNQLAVLIGFDGTSAQSSSPK